MRTKSISIVLASIMISACASTQNDNKLSAEEKAARGAEIQLEQAQTNQYQYREWKQESAAREQVKFYGDAVDYDIQTRDMYSQQFALGERSLLDVLDSENELYNSSMLLVTSKANEVGAGYKILAIAGHLIDSLGINRSAFAKEGVGGDPNEVNDWTERPVSPDPHEPAVAPEDYKPLAEKESGPME